MENKINQIKESMANLVTELEQASQAGKRIDKVEVHIFKSLLKMGKELLLFYMELVRGKTKKSLQGLKDKGYQNKGSCKSSYFSVFGLIDYVREKYHKKKLSTHWIKN